MTSAQIVGMKYASAICSIDQIDVTAISNTVSFATFSLLSSKNPLMGVKPENTSIKDATGITESKIGAW